VRPLGAQTTTASQQPDSANFQFRWLGVAGWEFRSNNVAVLVDPYLTRPAAPQIGKGQTGCPFCRPSSESSPEGNVLPLDSRPPFGDDRPLSDTALLALHITRADYILVTHAHPDHLLDVPAVAAHTGATVIGNESVTNVLRAAGLPESRLITVNGGEDLEFGKFSLRVLPSLHTLQTKSYHDSRVIPRDVKLPLRRRDYYEGGSRAFLLRFGERQILVFGSMNFIQREVEGLRPDIAIVGAAASRRQIHDYTRRLMEALGRPRLVLPTHWDDQFQSLAEAMVKPNPGRLAEVQAFTDEVRIASPTSRVIIPRYMEWLTINERR
jgi:L-ascorbate metabolism protein UlaG (beta-lactamase superfamily)